MPHIAITMYPGRDKIAKQELADNVSKCVIDTLGVPSSVVSVSIQDIAPSDWQENLDKYPEEVMFVKPE